MLGNKILLLSPHTDDGELGCGASVAKLVRQGKEVVYVAFSACEQSVLPQFPKDILIQEVKGATAALGIKPENLILHRFEVRTFNYHRQEILDLLIQLREEYKPDTVLIPSLNDIHQDHKTIAEEALRAFKFHNVISYEEQDVICKINALNQYQSQAHRPYANEEFLRSQLRMRGVQVARRYAEVFEVVRLVND
jgi:LmbE family N-acetylglucosaminyl deacetylase